MSRQHRAPLKPEKSATWEQAGDTQRSGSRAGGDLPASCPGAISFPAAAASASPSRGEGVKIQAPSGLKRWPGSGEARGTHKGTRHKKPLSKPVLSGPFRCRWGNLTAAQRGWGAPPRAGTSRVGPGCRWGWGSRPPGDMVPVERAWLWHCSPPWHGTHGPAPSSLEQTWRGGTRVLGARTHHRYPKT